MSWPSYNRDQLISDVIELLATKGVVADPVPERAGDRQKAATLLLSSLSIMPTLAPEVALDLDGHASYNARIHGD